MKFNQALTIDEGLIAEDKINISYVNNQICFHLIKMGIFGMKGYSGITKRVPYDDEENGSEKKLMNEFSKFLKENKVHKYSLHYKGSIPMKAKYAFTGKIEKYNEIQKKVDDDIKYGRDSVTLRENEIKENRHKIISFLNRKLGAAKMVPASLHNQCGVDNRGNISLSQDLKQYLYKNGYTIKEVFDIEQTKISKIK